MANPCRGILATNAGAVECRRNRASSTIITLYNRDAGIEDDPEFPWTTACEDHGSIVSHQTRELATRAMSWPDWCADCQEIMERRGLFSK